MSAIHPNRKPTIATCEHDKRRETMPEWPRYTGHCRECAITELATGPLFHHGRALDGAISAPYRRALALIFGDDLRNGHAIVKAKAEALHMAKRGML